MRSLNAGPLLPTPPWDAGIAGKGPIPVTVSVTGAESDVGKNRISKLS